MARLSWGLLMCLLAGLSHCQDKDAGNKTHITRHVHTKAEDQGFLIARNTTAHVEMSLPTVSHILEQLGAVKEKLTATVQALEETNKRLEASEKKLSAFNQTVTDLGTVGQVWPRIAFSAAYPTTRNIISGSEPQSLVYSRVLSNIGGHYSQFTGFFTAPVRGVYSFTYNSFCWTGDVRCGGSLYHNGSPQVSWYIWIPTQDESGSNSAILTLEVGDTVNIRIWENSRVSDNEHNYSTFSGFLVFPM